MPSPPRRSSHGCFFVYCAVLLFAGFVLLVAGRSGSLHPHRPRFTVAGFSVSGGWVDFNVSDTNPNRHYGILYKGSYEGSPRASLLLDGAAVAYTLVFDDDEADCSWYQPSMNTTSISRFLHVVDEPSFSAALRAGRGRLPLRMQLATPIKLSFLDFFPYFEKNMRVDCNLLVDADGRLLSESAGAPCNTYFVKMDDDD